MSYYPEHGHKVLRLQCADGEIHEIKFRTVKFSSTILNLLDDIGGIESYTGTTIPLTLHSPIFKKVLQWMVKHEDDVVSMDDDQNTQWDEEFINVEKRVVFDIMMAANYLSITKLVNLTCKVVANMIKGKNPEEIRNIFNYEVA